MELLIIAAVVWAYCGVASYRIEAKRNELFIFQYWSTHSTLEKVVNSVLYMLMFVAAGPFYLAYALYVRWKENQPFTTE